MRSRGLRSSSAVRAVGRHRSSDGAGGVDDLGQAAVVEGAGQAGGGDQAPEGGGAAPAAEGDVVGQGGVAVALGPDPELQGARLGQDVVDVIEGHQVDVALVLPAPALGRVGEVAPVPPGQVGLLHRPPQVVALGRRHRRAGVDLVLEVVDGRAVGQEQQRFGQVPPAEPVGVVAEEALHVGPGQELEAHGVDLGRLVGGPEVVGERQVAALVALEGVAHLVGEDLDVALGAVEVGEHERHAVGGEAGAEPAAGLALAVGQVEEAAGVHAAEERAEVAHGVEHLGGPGQHPVVVAERCGVAGQVVDGLVPGHQPVDARGRRSGGGGSRPRTGRRAPARRPAALDVGPVVVDPAHAPVAEAGEVVEAELGGHAGPQLDEVVEDAVELVAVGGGPVPDDLLGGVADGPVGALAVLLDRRQVEDLAVEGQLGRGQQLDVLGAELRLPGQVGLDGGVEGQHVGLPQGEGLGPISASISARPGMAEEGPLHGDLELRPAGLGLVPRLPLRLAVGIGRVLLEPQPDQGAVGLHLPADGVPGPDGGQAHVDRVGGGDAGLELADGDGQRVEVGSGGRHVAEALGGDGGRHRNSS